MSYPGPVFTPIDVLTREELNHHGGFSSRHRPLLVKGAIATWPAMTNWTFEKLAQLRRPDGSAVEATFQNGLIEQGVTRQPVVQAVAPYLLDLAAQASRPSVEEASTRGLCPESRFRSLKPGEEFLLNWQYLRTFPADRIYLAQWYILKEFPQLRTDFAIRSLWPGLRWTWEYVFMGPSQTITGLHTDFSNNWFCQVQGVKEIILFTPDNDAYLSRSRKFDWGAHLSRIDISDLEAQREHHDTFARARGLYARLEPGDALYMPKNTWHAVVSLEPSISLAVFGLTIPEIMSSGIAWETKRLLHAGGLYRRGDCTCHRMNADGRIRARSQFENLE